jgi:hypothetical protein
MLPTEYDLRVIEQRYVDLRAEAAAYRLARANQPAPTQHASLVGRLAALIHVPGYGHAQKGAMTPAA